MWTHLFSWIGWIILMLLAIPVALFFLGSLLMRVLWWRRDQLLWRESTESNLLLQKEREPNNSCWSKKLSDLYQHRIYGSSEQMRQEYSRKAFAEYERAYTLTPIPDGCIMLGRLAKMAFEAQAFDKARIYATELLQSSPHQPEYARGGAIHHGNLVLGRLALHSGDVAQAKKYLLASGRTSGGPGLETGGPNMTLVQGRTKYGGS